MGILVLVRNKIHGAIKATTDTTNMDRMMFDIDLQMMGGLSDNRLNTLIRILPMIHDTYGMRVCFSVQNAAKIAHGL